MFVGQLRIRAGKLEATELGLSINTSQPLGVNEILHGQHEKDILEKYFSNVLSGAQTGSKAE